MVVGRNVAPTKFVLPLFSAAGRFNAPAKSALPSSMTVVNMMALRHSAFYSPFLMTMAGGFLKEEGLEYNYRLATPENTVADSIIDGSCHLAQSAVATSFSALEAGNTNPFVHFAQINNRDGFFIASRKPEPNFSWQHLKHKKVLVDHFFQPYAMLKYGLHQQGVSFSDFTVIDAGDVDAIKQAFLNGDADYVHMQGPVPQQLALEEKAFVIAAVGEAVGPVAFSSLCASPQWLETDMAKVFMKAYKHASTFVLAAPAEEIAAKEIEAGFFPDINPQILADTIQAYQSLNCWNEDPIIPEDSYNNLLDVFEYNHLVTERYGYNELIAQPPSIF